MSQLFTFDKAIREVQFDKITPGLTLDSTGAFLVGQLEKLDPIINMPLQRTTWKRDVPIRTDLSIGHDTASFTLSTFSSNGAGDDNNANGNGIPFSGKSTTVSPSVEVDISKVSQPLYPWKSSVMYDYFELMSSQLLAQPIDVQKVEALVRSHDLQMDQLVYIGNTSKIASYTGLFNNPTVAARRLTGLNWSTATPAQIQADVNAIIADVVANSATAEFPDTLLVSFEDHSILTQPITAAGSISILEFIQANNLSKSNGVDFKILATKWSRNFSAGTTRRVAYCRNPRFLQFPYVPMQRLPLSQVGSEYRFDYVAKFGQMENRYPETMSYSDGAQ